MVIDQAGIWANIIGGSIAGLVSGLLISTTLWAISHFSRPKFEYFDVGNGLGHFYYNRYRPIIVGGSFVLGHGSALIERSARGGLAGFYMGPMHDQVFSTSTYLPANGGLSTGETVGISYRYAPFRYWWSCDARHAAFFQEFNPVDLYSSRAKNRKEARKDPEYSAIRKSSKGWKLAHVVLKPSATRTS